ncbi:Rhodanese-like domain [Trypanosoma melophagium]|uniref:Rhodanese-like domain n=1 Tax=Trypanosoma melophagium TaxID=715481 RepID=UPI00351A7B66|nr:Rhodanese-like domain [Trypanosoma melophagium]
MSAGYNYLEPAELVALLDGAEKEKVAVVDCRDEDRRGGHVVKSRHFPSATGLSAQRLAELADDLRRAGIAVAVFHCALSQVRGPRAAGRFAAILRDLGMDTPRVFVLRGGWELFHSIYHASRPDLIDYEGDH